MESSKVNNPQKIKNYSEQIQASLPSNSYRMINVGKKISTARAALAQGRIYIGKEAFTHLQNKTLPKGDPLVLSEIAGINGAKCAYQFIPLCHPLNLDHVTVHTTLNPHDYSVTVYCLASAHAKTGVEMEALAGANSALLAIYDLCKIITPDLSISDIRLIFKEGGKSGLWIHSQGIPDEIKNVFEFKQQTPLEKIRAVAFIMSESARDASHQYPDKNLHLKDELTRLGADVLHHGQLPYDKETIKQEIKKIIVDKSPDLIILQGGTGLSPRDVTSAAVIEIADRVIPGIAELLRQNGSQFNSRAWLNSSVAAIMKQTLIIVLPGCKEAINESLSVLPELIVKAAHELHQFD